MGIIHKDGIIIPSTKYNSVHKWVGRNYEKTGSCEKCGAERYTEWSNKTNQQIRDRNNWQELCKPCHYKYDRDVLCSFIRVSR